MIDLKKTMIYLIKVSWLEKGCERKSTQEIDVTTKVDAFEYAANWLIKTFGGLPEAYGIDVQPKETSHGSSG